LYFTRMKKQLFIYSLKAFLMATVASIIIFYIGYPELKNDLESLLYKGFRNAFFFAAIFTFIKWRELKKKGQ